LEVAKNMRIESGVVESITVKQMYSGEFSILERQPTGEKRALAEQNFESVEVAFDSRSSSVMQMRMLPRSCLSLVTTHFMAPPGRRKPYVIRNISHAIFTVIFHVIHVPCTVFV